MKRIIYIYSIVIVLISIILLPACTDLEEQIIDESTGEEFIKEENIINLVAPSYNTLANLWYRERIWGLQEATTDECMFPTRGKDWFDGGVFQEDFLHNWTPQHRDVVATWNELSTGISRANYSLLLLDEFAETQQTEWFKAELRFNRAFFMYYYMDLYGKVPYREYTETNFAINPQVFNRTQAFNFLTREIKEIMPQLGDKYDVPYGRPNKDAARMFLAKLYLNKEVYTGEEAYDSCLTYVNELINSGRYALDPDYFNIFSPTNQDNYTDNDEAILVAVLDDRENMGHTTHVVWVQHTFHYNQTLGGHYNDNWNGCAAPQDYLESLIANTDTSADVRWKDDRIYEETAVYLGFNYGQQYDANGTPLTTSNNVTPLFFTWECPLDTASERNGVRVLKYEPKIPPVTLSYIDNDYVIWRIADAYLMRAECYLRGGNNVDALKDINNLRTIRNAPELTSVDLDAILAERALELYWEGHRRQDLIRFGKFLDSRINKPEVSPVEKLLMPIPQNAIDAIDVPDLLKQNPGY
jgi:Tfp pilus assembly protein PilZ